MLQDIHGGAVRAAREGCPSGQGSCKCQQGITVIVENKNILEGILKEQRLGCIVLIQSFNEQNQLTELYEFM